MQGVAAPLRTAEDPLALTRGQRSDVRARIRERLAAHTGGVYDLVAYHLGWRDKDGVPCDSAPGKMLRPALLLTVAEGYAPGDGAVDAAAAIELLHAFSLVHDDIEDGDVERHHRPTLWALHGVPLALNAGDSLFALAHEAMMGAAATVPSDGCARALRIFNGACLRMIEGQHDDLSFEASRDVTCTDYERMTRGKTGALIGASMALGAVMGGAPDRDVDALHGAGVELGVAFQAVDDALAVWGDAARTGKAVGNDETRGKQSLPVVLARELAVATGMQEVRTACAAWAAERAGRALAAVHASSMAGAAKVRIAALADFILRREA